MLRDYQKEAISLTFRGLSADTKSRPLIVAPTGAGKSILCAEIARKLLLKNSHVKGCILVPSLELVGQNAEWLERLNVPYGIYCAGYGRKRLDKPWTLGTIQSLKNAKSRFNFAIIDEAHRVPKKDEGMYREFLAQHTCRVVGLTGTPFRLSCGSLIGGDSIFTEASYMIEVGELLKRGYLAPLVVKPVEQVIDTSQIRISNGEFVASSAEAVIANETLTKQVIADVISARRKGYAKGVVFATSVSHAEYLRKAFSDAGLDAITITNKTNKIARYNMVRKFKDQPDGYLIGVNIFVEGFDAPNVNLLVVLRPTMSTGLYMQLMGRGMRVADGKTDCLVLDYAGNVDRHGPVDLPWSSRLALIPSKERRELEAKEEMYVWKYTKIMTCPNCEQYTPAHEPSCIKCGKGFIKAQKHKKDYSFTAPCITNDSNATIRAKVHSYQVEVSRSGKAPHLKVVYTLDRSEITDYFFPLHEGYAKMITLKKLKLFGVDVDIERGISAWAKEVHSALKKLKWIEFLPKGKYKEVVSYEIEESQNEPHAGDWLRSSWDECARVGGTEKCSESLQSQRSSYWSPSHS